MIEVILFSLAPSGTRATLTAPAPPQGYHTFNDLNIYHTLNEPFLLLNAHFCVLIMIVYQDVEHAQNVVV